MAPSKRKGKTSEPITPSPDKVIDSKQESESDTDGPMEISATDETAPVKVNNASIAELKNALDDSIKICLTKNHTFTEDHTHDDVKLILGWASCLLAGGVSLAGWYFGWEKTQFYTGYFVGLYAVLSGILTAYVTMVQKQIIYVGTRESTTSKSLPERITVSTQVSSFDPIYKLSVEYEVSKKNGLKKYKTSLAPHFKQFFDVEGTLDEPGWHSYLDEILKTAVAKA
ncbi:hypothetical protein CROQUDRAFT_653826 [Cronartium quercuum f. sp. fusiforme G11]|uniref:Signal peptidase complex subunit 2 n=1 Tax=Cronartium quercuum f. sp. fusiforme G11 TaxID=708437 RepID=A0A9P6TE93_9BASI|nr:hypothetical protein CROQUDRAFT_653826 [Cronartium quercuum f. sp. fusiforme G11]